MLQSIPQMFMFAQRLASFKPSRRRSSVTNSKTTQPMKWPHPELSPKTLADAGFYFDPSFDSADNVTCYLCEKSLDGWEPGDGPLEEHLRHSKDCGWALTAAVLTEGEGQYANEPHGKVMSQARSKTFGTNVWPHSQNPNLSIPKMVDAGFHYAPIKDSPDYAFCPYCHVSLAAWAAEDDPWTEHQTRAPDCFFISSKPAKKQVKRSSRSTQSAAKTKITTKIKRKKPHARSLDQPLDVLSSPDDSTIKVNDYTEGSKNLQSAPLDKSSQKRPSILSHYQAANEVLEQSPKPKRRQTRRNTAQIIHLDENMHSTDDFDYGEIGLVTKQSPSKVLEKSEDLTRPLVHQSNRITRSRASLSVDRPFEKNEKGDATGSGNLALTSRVTRDEKHSQITKSIKPGHKSLDQDTMATVNVSSKTESGLFEPILVDPGESEDTTNTLSLSPELPKRGRGRPKRIISETLRPKEPKLKRGKPVKKKDRKEKRPVAISEDLKPKEVLFYSESKIYSTTRSQIVTRPKASQRIDIPQNKSLHVSPSKGRSLMTHIELHSGNESVLPETCGSVPLSLVEVTNFSLLDPKTSFHSYSEEYKDELMNGSHELDSQKDHPQEPRDKKGQIVQSRSQDIRMRSTSPLQDEQSDSFVNKIKKLNVDEDPENDLIPLESVDLLEPSLHFRSEENSKTFSSEPAETRSTHTPSKQLVKAAVPWIPTDFEKIIGNSTKKVMTTHIGLSDSEKDMTVEEWIKWNSAQGERRLLDAAERLVGAFEDEGRRAIASIESMGHM